MPSKSQSVSQSKRAKSNLKKLKDLGLYKGDLRRKPSKAALRAIAKFDAVLKGNAKVVQPKDPKRFKNIFDVVGKNVIVPKRKGEKISVDKKTGEIVSVRKVGNRTVTARGKQLKRGQKLDKPAPERRVQYAIPFHSTGGGTNWMRFPSWDMLQKFMAGYDYKGWQDYVVVEDVSNELDDDELQDRLEAKRKGRRIRGGLPKTVKTTRGKTRKPRR